MDSSGNLWVTDSANNEIREITTSGRRVTTPDGTWHRGQNQWQVLRLTFNTPTGNSRGLLRVISTWPITTTTKSARSSINECRQLVCGLDCDGTAGHANGTGTAATFTAPSGMAMDSAGNLYVADTNNSEIRMVTPDAVVSTYAGSTPQTAINGTSSAARFIHPFGIVIDASGNLYVGDDVNNEIRKIVP